MILTGYLLIGCVVLVVILVHDLITSKNDDTYKWSYSSTSRNLRNTIFNVLAWPFSVAAIILYCTNKDFKDKIDSYVSEKMSRKDD